MKKYIILMISLLCLSLNGCTAMLVGGGGGGYAAPQNVSLVASVKSALINDNKINAFNISVGAYQGVVTLTGHVTSSAQITRSIQISRTISGVKKIVSKLRVIK